MTSVGRLGGSTGEVCAPPRQAETALDDLRQGYIVIVAARWLLVSAGLLFILYRPQSVTELTEGVLAVLVIAAINFFLHTRPLTKQAIEPMWAYLASAADVTAISALIVMQGSGLTGKVHAFYYPAILVYSLVFPPGVTMLLTAGVLGFILAVAQSGTFDDRVLVAQVLTLAATALIGWRYREVEKRRRDRRAEFAREPFAAEAGRIENQEDLFYGQIVCIIARWAVIAGALFLAIYRPASVTAMETSLIPLMLLVAANFFLQARYMMGLPANALLLQCATVIDLIVVSAMTAGNPEFFVFYYPVVLAFALVFARRLALIFTGVVGVAYTLIAVLFPPHIHFNGDEKMLAIRLVTLLGTALLGTMYWRIQRARSREAS